MDSAIISNDIIKIAENIVKIFYIAYDVMEPVFFTYLIVQMISNGFVFQKSGEKKGKAVIPLYKDYVQAKISGSTKFFGVFLSLHVFIFAYIYGANAIDRIFPFSLEAQFASYIFVILIVIFLQVLTAIAGVRLAQSFGKSKGFTVGLVLFNILFLPMLAFGDSEYKGNLYIKNKKQKNN